MVTLLQFTICLFMVKMFLNLKNLKLIKGDLRNEELLDKSLNDQEIVIHLACISNDPSFELNPDLGKSINFDAFEPFKNLFKKECKRFIYASSSSVYGIKNEKDVTEDMSLEPLTDYSKFKVECENILIKEKVIISKPL